MSKSPSNSRSPTPTATLPQIIPEDLSRDPQSSGVRDESFAPLPVPPPSTQDIGRPSIRPAENSSSSSDSRMVKRIRTSDLGSGSSHMQSGSPQDNVASSSSSRITSSREQPMVLQNPPPKKKRTRTLTTPHQAAVLHGLLAKSRFPTTAMREEVGRSIGLSARKVQIWFQNQRQKARRPGGQSEASCRGRPQYGAFSSAPPPVPEYGNQLSFNTRPDANSLSLIQMTSSSSQSLQPTGNYVSTPESYSTLSDTPSQLLGPGVPGLHMRPRGAPLGGSTSSSISLPQIDQLDVNYPATRPIHRNSPPKSPNSVHLLPPPLSVPSHLQDAYPTLPPLMSLQTRASASPPAGPMQSLPTHLSLIDTLPQPGSTMDHPFIHYTPASPRAVGTSASPAGGSATPGSIPPPFTLQPRPQWDRRSFTPSLARSSLWSSSSSNRSSVSPTQPFFVPSARSPPISSVSTPNLGRHDAQAGPIGEKTDWDAQPMASQTPPSSQSRVGRYDPVRATVIPFPTALPPPSRSPPDTEHMKDRS